MSVIAPGNVAVITGGASGIGLALAERFIAEGMRVVLADIDAPKLRDVEARLSEAGADVATMICDTTAEAAVNELAEFTLESFGAAHVLCNNAGILGVGDAWRDPIELWERVLGVNLYGVIHGIRAFLPIMEQQGVGHIVNTASMAGLTAAGQITSYVMTKHAIVGMSLALRSEAAAHGVGVLVVCPSAIETPLLEKGGIGGFDGRNYFLQGHAGKAAYPADRLAQDTLKAIESNKAVLVKPRSAHGQWLFARLAPGLMQRASIRFIASQRAHQAGSRSDIR